MTQSRKLFGTDGIRGEANGELLTPELALKVGQAAGILFRRTMPNHVPKVVIGKDTRLSCYMIEQALTAGFLSVGVHVYLTGPIPTPAVSRLTRSMLADVGVMISASHNSFEDNGIKLFRPDGHKLSDEMEAQIDALVRDDAKRASQRVTSRQIGRAKRIDEAPGRYIELVKGTVPNLSLEGKRGVIDCAHGAAYEVAPWVLQELGAEVIAIGVSPNGTNINHECGSTHPQALIDKVREMRADFGIALDGDADRVVLADEKGNIVDGDQVLALIASDWKTQGRPLTGVVGTIMSNGGLEKYLSTLDLPFHRAQVGDRYVLEMMQKEGCALGGEQSGHIIMSDYSTTGDGLAAALQVLAIAMRQGRLLSELAHCFERVPQVQHNIRAPGGLLEVPAIKLAIAAAEEKLVGGRVVVRPSGTEPLIRVMLESSDRNLIEAVLDDLHEAFRKAQY